MVKFFKNKKRVCELVAILSAIIIVWGGLIGGFLYLLEHWTLPEDLKIAGVSVGDMNFKKALTAVNTAKEDYQNKDLVIDIDGEVFSLKQDLSQVKINTLAAVIAAFVQPKNTGIMDITAFMTVNEEQILASLNVLAEKLKSTLAESTYEVRGERPNLSAHTVTGDGQTLVISKGTPDAYLDTDMLYRAIISCYNNGEFSLAFPLTATPPKEPDWEAIYKQHCTAPVDAVMNMETFEVSKHAYGYCFSIDSAKESYASAEYGTEVTIPFTPVAPGALHDDVKAILYRDVLGSYTATAASQYNRNINLKLSCEAINGKVLFPGQTLSYNTTLGRRTAEKGYRPATSYWGSEIITSYGGGICQASSCLYYAALIADIEIVERTNHGYVSSYMPLGMDATVDWHGPDLKIRNNTDYPIRIEAHASGGTVTVKLVGTDTKDYYVKMTYDVLSKTPYKTVYVDMEEGNSKGYKNGEVISSPYTGYKIRTYKCKYSKETDELISWATEATSTYYKKDKEICRIKPKEATPPPTTTLATTAAGITGSVTEDS